MKSNFVPDDTLKGTPLPEDMERKMLLKRNGLTIAKPANTQESEQLTWVMTGMEGTYGKGKYCPQPAKCQDLEDLSKVIAESCDRKLLQEAWTGWHAIAKPLRAPFTQFVVLSNKSTREWGFAQDWQNIYPLLEPNQASAGYHLSHILQQRHTDAKQMAGFAPLPPTFWERSLFTKPRDREVVMPVPAISISKTTCGSKCVSSRPRKIFW